MVVMSGDVGCWCALLVVGVRCWWGNVGSRDG